MSKKVWFGIPGKKMLLLPAPSINSSFSNNYYSESIGFENGGADVRRSNQFHKQYSFQVVGTAEYFGGINEYSRFYSGYYGEGLKYFSDPYVHELNVLPPVWASPGLIESGWANISPIVPTFVDTPTNSFGLPPRSAVFDLEYEATVDADRFYATIPIPPDMTLHLGATGSATGGAGVSVLPILVNNTEDTVQSLTLNAPTSDVRMNAEFDGSVFQAVKIFLPTTSTVGSVLTLSGIMGQLFKTSATPQLTSFHIPGEGHTGLEFSGEAVSETYVYIDPPRKGVSFEMLEVGAWR